MKATLDLPPDVLEKVRLRDQSERLCKELAVIKKKMAKLREDYKALKKQESKKQIEIFQCCAPEEDWAGPLVKLAYQGANGTAWTNLPIEQLIEHGLPQRFCTLLAKHKIGTMGQFAQAVGSYQGAHLDAKLESIVGSEHAGSAAEAWESFQKSIQEKRNGAVEQKAGQA